MHSDQPIFLLRHRISKFFDVLERGSYVLHDRKEMKKNYFRIRFASQKLCFFFHKSTYYLVIRKPVQKCSDRTIRDGDQGHLVTQSDLG